LEAAACGYFEVFGPGDIKYVGQDELDLVLGNSIIRPWFENLLGNGLEGVRIGEYKRMAGNLRNIFYTEPRVYQHFITKEFPLPTTVEAARLVFVTPLPDVSDIGREFDFWYSWVRVNLYEN
jgi:hypothetical protein